MTKPKLEQVMGKRSAEFYTEYLNQVVNIMGVSGQIFKGALLGVEQYDLLLRQESRLELRCNKGITIHRAPAGENRVT